MNRTTDNAAYTTNNLTGHEGHETETGKSMPPAETDSGNHTLAVHHIGYLVRKIEKAIAEFQHLGYTVRQDTVLDTIRGIHICFMEKDGYMIELVSPAANGSPVSNLIKRYKNSPYHICYTVKDLDKELAHLTAEGYTAIDTPAPAPALGSRRVVFLMNPFLGMIELLEA